jgi:hypothetical protein
VKNLRNRSEETSDSIPSPKIPLRAFSTTRWLTSVPNIWIAGRTAEFSKNSKRLIAIE